MDCLLYTMYFALFLILIIFVIVSTMHLWKIDTCITLFYAISAYVAISLLGIYLFKPEVLIYSKNIYNNVFNIQRQGWGSFYFFSFFSLICLYFFFLKTLPNRNSSAKIYLVNLKISKIGVVCFLYFFAFVLLILFIQNYEVMNYWNFNNSEFRVDNPGFDLLCTLFLGCASIITCIGTQLFFLPKNYIMRQRAYIFPFLIMLILYSLYVVKTGDRSSLFILLMGFGGAYIYTKKDFSIIKLGMLILLVYILLQIVATMFRHEQTTSSFVEIIFPSSLFSNAISLFSVIRFNYVDPINGLITIISKSIILTDTPYLYEQIAGLMTPVEFNGSFGLGYYVFADGFIVAGWLGVLVNTFIVGGLIVFLRKLGRSNDYGFNMLIYVYLFSHVLSYVRGMGICSIVKSFYTDLALCILVYLLMNGKWIVLKKKKL